MVVSNLMVDAGFIPTLPRQFSNTLEFLLGLISEIAILIASISMPLRFKANSTGLGMTNELTGMALCTKPLSAEKTGFISRHRLKKVRINPSFLGNFAPIQCFLCTL